MDDTNNEQNGKGNELVVINELTIFPEPDGLTKRLIQIEEKYKNLVFDLSDAKGRKACISAAAEVTRYKTHLVKLGNESIASDKEKIRRVTSDIKRAEAFLTELSQYVRQPVTELEKREKEFLKDWDDAISENNKRNQDAIEAKMKAEREAFEAEKAETARKQKEEADRLAKERAEVQAEKDRLAKEEADRKAAAEKEEREKRIAAESKAKAEKDAADKIRKAEDELKRNSLFCIGFKWDGQQWFYKDVNVHWADIALISMEDFNVLLEKVKTRKKEIDAKEAEAKRLADEQRKQEEIKAAEQRVLDAQKEKERQEAERVAKEKAENDKRAADEAHRAKIISDISFVMKEIYSAYGSVETRIAEIICAIIDGRIPHVLINFGAIADDF